MADRHGFIVLYPEQQRANHPGLCFNWYSPEDARRGGGEAASIRSAIETAIAEGRAPMDLTKVQIQSLRLHLSWAEQRKMLGLPRHAIDRIDAAEAELS